MTAFRSNRSQVTSRRSESVSMKEYNLSQKIICFCLAMAVFFVPLIFSNSPSIFKAAKLFLLQILIISAFAIWFWKMLKETKFIFIKTPIDLHILLLLLLGLTSLFFSQFRFYSAQRIIEIIYYVVAFYLASNCLSQRSLRKFVVFSASAGLVLVCLYGFAQYFELVGIDWASRPWGFDFGKRIFATEGNPNWLASYLILLLPLAFAMTLSNTRVVATIIFGLIFFMAFVCLLMTNSWAAFLGFLVSVATLRFWLRKEMKEGEFQKWRVMAWCLGISIFIFVVIKGPQAFGNTTPLTGRFLWWQAALRMTVDRPLLGVGLDNFQVYSAKYEGEILSGGQFLKLWQTHIPFRKTFRAHNEYLDVAAEMGIIAFLIFLIAFISFAKYTFEKYKRLKEKEDKLLYAGLAGGLIALCIEAFFGFPFHLVTPSFFSALFLGMIVAGSEEKRRYINLPIKAIFSKIGRSLLLIIVVLCLAFSLRPLMAAIYLTQGEALENKSKFSLAQEKYQKAKAWYTHHPMISFRQAVTYRKMKEYDKAILALSDSLKEEPYLMHNYLNLALNYTALKDYKKAITAYEKLTQLKPRYDYAIRNLAFAYLLDNNFEQAISTMQKLVLLNESEPWSHNSLGVIYGKSGDFKNAAEHFRQALKIEPTNPVFLSNLEAVEQKKDNFKDPLFEEFLQGN